MEQLGYMKLSELCKAVGISRRCVQGYEKEGLMGPVDKNKYGHLLYDQATLERARRIHFLQEIGFRVKEIKGLIDAPEEVVRAAVAGNLPKLRRREKELGELIEKVEKFVGEDGMF